MLWSSNLYLALLAWAGIAELIASVRFHLRPLLFSAVHNLLLLALWAIVLSVTTVSRSLLMVVFLSIVYLKFALWQRLKIDTALKERGITNRMIYFFQRQAPR